MNRQHDEELCRIAPHLFGDGLASMQSTWCCGFDCGDGWFDILKKAALKLEPLIVAAIAEDPVGCKLSYYRASQIKEKYGTLRFYLTGGTDKMYEIADKAEKQSAKTCEECGKPGILRGYGWVYTRCAKCWKRMDK